MEIRQERAKENEGVGLRGEQKEVAMGKMCVSTV